MQDFSRPWIFTGLFSFFGPRLSQDTAICWMYAQAYPPEMEQQRRQRISDSHCKYGLDRSVTSCYTLIVNTVLYIKEVKETVAPGKSYTRFSGI